MQGSSTNQSSAISFKDRLIRWYREWIPRPIGWSVDEQIYSRRKMIQIFSGLVAAAVLAGVLGGLMVAFPQAAGLLWFLQILCVLALLGFTVAALACARRCYFDPLTRVREWASEIRQGDFSARVPLTDDSEYTDLSDDINRLAEWLESLALDVEGQLRRQAERLAVKSQSLQLLHDVASGISVSADIDELAGKFLHALVDAIGAKAGRVYLYENRENPRMVQSVGFDDALANTTTTSHLTSVDKFKQAESDNLTAIEIPLQHHDRVLGQYKLYVDADSAPLSSDMNEMLNSIGRQLGIAVEKFHLDKEQQRISRIEARTQLSNELHDSLAQTLASLRFQVRVLDDTLHQDDESAIWEVMERLEASMDEAYAELRELISHFRAPIDKRGLLPAIEAAASRFRKQTDIPVFIQNEWDEKFELPDEWDMQIVRIIQESLTNCRKHSNASAVRILLSSSVDGVHRVLIEDDGEGFDQPVLSNKPGEHIGLSIMRERGKKIGGDVRIDSEPGEGTRVELTFPSSTSQNMTQPKRSVA